VLNDAKLLSGQRQVRDAALLDAAAARPAQSAFGEDAYPTLPEKAGALLHALARNHPFTDGNKRTATVAVLFMLRANGHCAEWPAEDALRTILDVAEGRSTLDKFVSWLAEQLRPCTPLPDPDAEQDMLAIARIFVEHQWLLDELKKQ
jgi:death-on-curing protein